VTRAVLGTGAVTGSLGHAAVCGVGGYTRRRAQHRVRQEGVRRWWIGKSQNNILPKARPRGTLALNRRISIPIGQRDWDAFRKPELST
jgi:hypothetical protein